MEPCSFSSELRPFDIRRHIVEFIGSSSLDMQVLAPLTPEDLLEIDPQHPPSALMCRQQRQQQRLQQCVRSGAATGGSDERMGSNDEGSRRKGRAVVCAVDVPLRCWAIVMEFMGGGSLYDK